MKIQLKTTKSSCNPEWPNNKVNDLNYSFCHKFTCVICSTSCEIDPSLSKLMSFVSQPPGPEGQRFTAHNEKVESSTFSLWEYVFTTLQQPQQVDVKSFSGGNFTPWMRLGPSFLKKSVNKKGHLNQSDVEKTCKTTALETKMVNAVCWLKDTWIYIYQLWQYTICRINVKLIKVLTSVLMTLWQQEANLVSKDLAWPINARSTCQEWLDFYNIKP